MAGEARVHLGHAREELLLIVRQRIPRAHEVGLDDHVGRGPGVDRRQLGVRGTMPWAFMRARVSSRYFSYPISNLPLYLSTHSFGAWCGRRPQRQLRLGREMPLAETERGVPRLQ